MLMVILINSLAISAFYNKMVDMKLVSTKDFNNRLIKLGAKWPIKKLKILEKDLVKLKDNK